MQSRTKNLAMLLPETTMQAVLALAAASRNGPVAQRTLELVHLRASQINGCGFCVDMHARAMKKAGESDERLWAVAAWRESPHFSEAERAALALAEAATRIADSDGVPDDVWNEAARHYDDKALAQLVLNIGLINFFNCMNVTTRQIAGSVKFDH